MPWTTRSVRIGVITALGVPAAVILMATALQAQIRPPGGGQIGGGPPPFPPGGQIGGGQIGGGGAFRGGGQIGGGQIGGGAFRGGGQIGGGGIQQVWSCGKCKRDVGTGAFPPANCPFCGVRLINGMGPANPPGGMMGGPAPGGMMGGPPPGGMAGGAPMPGAGMGGINPNPPNTPIPPAGNNNRPQNADGASSGRAGLIVGLVIGGVLFVLIVAGVIGAVVYFSMQGEKKPRMKKRRRRSED